MMPSDQFARSVAANLAFWRRRTGILEQREIFSLDSERANLFRAVEHGLVLDETRQDTAELILKAYQLVELRGYWREWIPLLEQAIDRIGAQDLALKGGLLNRLGEFYRLNRQLDAAQETHLMEEQIGLELGDRERLAYARLCLGKIAWNRHEHGKAERYAEAALTDFQAIEASPEKIGSAWSLLGLAAQSQGQFHLAEERLQQSVNVNRAAEQPAYLAQALKNLAVLQEEIGQVDEALANYQEALRILEGTDADLEKSLTELSLGTLYFKQGKLEKAEAAYARADSAYLRRSGHTFQQAMVANNLGNVYLALGLLEKAEKALCLSVDLWQRSGAQLMLANSLGTLAETYESMGRVKEARMKFSEAIALAERFPDDNWACEMTKHLAEHLARLNRDS